ncbi:hypothetical protein KDC22_26155 [Paenibacillus tritici]|uniref:hypothetical protein n=1 Tax=Paenibacillus tritici TaxID=1873425 RepID=UPI001BAB3437|nr:hypothetical protein [Paenibacillus tritici]QUL53797.1 hypothetical protein KDC22_26155 [Paenibacillus tritici]
MQKQRSYTGLITVIYIAALTVTLGSFFMFGFSESLMRFVVTLLAVCIAETAVYGYSLVWLRRAPEASRTSPLFLSGALIMALYVAAVLASAIVLDWLLELHPLWYAGEQLLVLIAAALLLAATGGYGWNAASGERKAAEASRSLRTHRQELHEIRVLAGTWKHPEAGRLVELVEGLEEKFRYSDPVSRPGLFATEDIIKQQISLLHDHVALLLVLKELPVRWDTETQELTESIAGTLQRRNLELSALK